VFKVEDGDKSNLRANKVLFSRDKYFCGAVHEPNSACPKVVTNIQENGIWIF
jgi:hypothetical protein